MSLGAENGITPFSGNFTMGMAGHSAHMLWVTIAVIVE